MMTFFGADPSVSHFTVSERYLLSRDEDRRDATARRKDQRAKLKELGFQKPYFQFRNKDEAGKIAARAKADAFAAEWTAKAGFELEVAEGCFL
jgi:hypothetical protein